MIGLTMLGGYALVGAAAAIASTVGAVALEGLARLSRCCMSARTLVADVARVDEPHRIEDMPGHLEAVRHLSDPGEHETYWDTVEDLLDDDGIVAVVFEHGWVQ